MRRGEAKEKIISAAERLFAERWYSTVSVADICRTAGVSNGIAYHYFDNKEELLEDLMERTIRAVDTAPSLNGSEDPDKRLMNYIGDLLDLTENRKHLIRAFRQGQYRMIEYESKLHEVYSRHLEKVLGRQASRMEYIFAMSGLRFVNIRHAFDSVPADKATMFGILKRGAFPGNPARPLADFLPKRILRPSRRLWTGRARLIAAGKELIGAGILRSVSISDITGRAESRSGRSTGTSNQGQVPAEIVRDIEGPEAFHQLNMPACRAASKRNRRPLPSVCTSRSILPVTRWSGRLNTSCPMSLGSTTTAS